MNLSIFSQISWCINYRLITSLNEDQKSEYSGMNSELTWKNVRRADSAGNFLARAFDKITGLVTFRHAAPAAKRAPAINIKLSWNQSPKHSKGISSCPPLGVGQQVLITTVRNEPEFHFYSDVWGHYGRSASAFLQQCNIHLRPFQCGNNETPWIIKII